MRDWATAATPLELRFGARRLHRGHGTGGAGVPQQMIALSSADDARTFT